MYKIRPSFVTDKRVTEAAETASLHEGGENGNKHRRSLLLSARQSRSVLAGENVVDVF